MALRNSMLAGKRLIVKNEGNVFWMRRQPKSNLMPMGGGFGSMFKGDTIAKNWETIPLFVSAFIAAALPFLHIAFHYVGAEDISFVPGRKMKNQKHCQVFEGKPKPTKYLTFNQKWEWPKGLIEALKEDCPQGRPQACKKTKK